MRRAVWIALCTIVAVAVPASHADKPAVEAVRPRPFPGAQAEESPSYPLYQRLRHADDPRPLLRSARAFVDSYPEAAEAPRAVMDWLMAARMLRDTTAERAAQTRLLLAYPESLQAAYVASQFTQPIELTRLLEGEFDEHLDRPSSEFDAQFLRALQNGHRQFRAGFFSNDQFDLKCWLHATGAGDAALADAARQALQGSTRNQREINEIVLDEAADPLERIRRLQSAAESGAAGEFVRFLLARLPEERRQEPAVKRLTAGSLIRQKQFESALEVIRSIPNADLDAEMLYARGCAEFSMGDPAAAVASFQEIEERFADTPWRDSARELRLRVETASESLAQQSVIATRALVHMLDSKNDRWQATAVWRPESPRSIRAIVDYDLKADSLELALVRGESRVFAYRSDGQSRTYLLPGETVAYRYPEKGHMIPVLDFSLETEGRKQHFTFNTNLGSGETLQQSVLRRRGLLSDESLRGPSGVAKLLQAAFSFSAVPCAPESDSEVTRFVWLRPDISTPSIEREEVQFDSSGRLRRIRLPEFELRDIRYGSSDSLPLMGSPLTGIEIREQSKVDPAVAMRALAALFETFRSELEEETGVAGAVQGAVQK